MSVVLDTASRPDDELPDIPAALSKPVKVAPRPQAPQQNPYAPLIKKHAAAENLDDDLISSMMGTESAGKPGATSWAGNQGLLQTSQDVVNRFVKPGEFGSMDPKKPEVSIAAGTRYMRWLLDRYKGDHIRALAGYNAGEGNADRADWQTAMEKWSNDRAVQQGLKPRGASDPTNTANYTRKIDNAYQNTLPDIPDLPHDDLPDIPDHIGIGARPSPTNQGTGPKPLTPAQQPYASKQTPVPERPETLEAQRKAAADPRSTRAGVLYTPGTAVPAATKDEEDIGLADGQILRVNKAKFVEYARQTGITAADLQSGAADFTPLIGGKAQQTNDTSSKLGVTTKDAKGNELVSSSVEEPSAVPQEAAMQKAQFPGQPTETHVTHSDAIVAARTAKPTVGPRPGKKQAAMPVSAPTETAAAPSPEAAPPEGTPHTDVRILDEEPAVRPVHEIAGDEDKVKRDLFAAQAEFDNAGNDREIQKTARAKIDAAESQLKTLYNAPAEIIDIPQDIKTQAAATKYAKDQLQAKYPDADFSKSQYLSGWHPGRSTYLTFGDLKNAGVNTDALIREQKAQQRVGEAPIDAKNPYDQKGASVTQKMRGLSPEAIDKENLEADPLYKLAQQNINEYGDGDVNAEYARLKANEGMKIAEAANKDTGFVAANMMGGSGRTAHFFAGVLHLINSLPRATFVGDPKDQSFTDWAEQWMRSEGNQMEANKAEYDRRNPDQNIFKKIAGMGLAATSDVPRLLAIPGKGYFVFGSDALAQSVGKQGYVDEAALKAGGSNALTGLLFHGAGVAGENVKGGLSPFVASDKLLHLYGRAASIGTVAAGTTAQHLLEGATPDEAFDAGVQMGLFDVFFQGHKDFKILAGRSIEVTDGVRTKTVTIMPDGEIVQLKRSPKKPDAVLDISALENKQKYFNKDANIQGQVKRTEARANVAVPETPAEPEKQQYTSQLDEIRQNKADTTAKIQALFPDAGLSRQQAADLRRQAWENPTEDFDVTGKDGRRFKVQEDRGKMLLVKDEKGSITLQPERKFTDLEAFRSKPATVTHPNEKIDGQPIVAKTVDGRVIVPNPENKTGISIVKDRGEQSAVSSQESAKTEPRTDEVASFATSDEGTKQAMSATDAAHEAATSPKNDLPEPTEAMKEAGNYKKGHILINGLDISVENPVGSKREGVGPDGTPWSNTMRHHYGYIKGSIGADAEHVDLFVKDKTPADYAGPVFVVDQVHPDTGKFDEHKVMLGFDTEAEAREAYQSNYAKDWKGLKSITEMPFEEFKTWAKAGVQDKPAENFTIEGQPSSENDPVSRIRELVAAPKETSGANPKIVLRSLNADDISSIKAATGLEVGDDYSFVLEKAALNHILNKHANENIETSRGQVAVTHADFERIPEILDSPDYMYADGKTRQGRDVLIFAKKFNGHTLLVEEIRTGNKELAVASMRKYKNGSDLLPKPKVSTPEAALPNEQNTTGASDSPRPNAQDDSVAQSPQRTDAESNAQKDDNTSEVQNERSKLSDESAAAGPGTPEGSGGTRPVDGETAAAKEEKGEGAADDRGQAEDVAPEKKAKTAPTAMQKFLADDKAHELTQEILEGSPASGDEADIAVAKLQEIGKNYGLSERQVQGVIDRARENRQRAENKRKASDIVRESRQPKGPVVEGSATTVLTPESSKEYEARYVVREASDIVPSHNHANFQPNPDYYYTNDRHYDREEQYQKQVIDRAKAFKPQYFVTDAPTAADGPPVIDAEGNVLGGNSRAMILKRIYEDENSAARKAYQVALHQKAKQFGIDAGELLNFDRPVLVREISDESINKQHAITELNETSTTDLTTQEQAVADAGKLSDESVEYITNKIAVTGAEASLTDALNAHGVAIVNHLIEDGVFGEGERNKFIDNGEITADGKKRIERLLLGKVFTDLGQIENATPSVNNTVVRIVAPLMKVNEDPDWNILPEVQEGIELLNEAKAAGQGNTIDGFAANLNFLRPEGWSRQAIAIAKVLNLGQVKASNIFKQYAEDMRLAKYGSDAMFDMGAKTQEQAYSDAFGVEPAAPGEPEPDAKIKLTKDSEQTTDTPQKGPDGNSAAMEAEPTNLSDSTVKNNAAAPETIEDVKRPEPVLDFRVGDRVRDDFGRKGVVFKDKHTGELHVEQDGTRARLPLSSKWELAGKRPLEFNGLKKGDVVQKKQQLGKVYERGGQLRVKWTKDGKTKSEPLSEKWAKGSNPEAGSIDPTLLTLGLNKTIAEDVAPGIKRVGAGLRDAANDIRSLVFAGGRGEAARLGATSLRAETGKMARSALIAETALKQARKYFAGNPIDDNYDFIAHIEADDIRSLPPDEMQTAHELRRLLDESRKRVQGLGTGKLEAYIENYFPHIWQDPTKAASVFAKVLARRPFEGSKSFLKQRKYNTFQEGLDAGLIPVSDNPVDLTLLKIRDMDRYVAAHRTVAYLKEQGLAKFVSTEDHPPEGFIKLDDKIGDIYAPPVVVQKEYVDKAVYEGLSRLADGLGISHERVANAGRGRIGYSEQGNDRVVTQYATGERVIAHEISHQLDHKYGMIDRFINNADPKLRAALKKELRVLADSKQASFDQPEGYKTTYTRKKVEQMAHILESYVNNKELLGRIAPTVKTEFEKMIDEHPELGIIKQIERSLGKEELQTEVKRGFVKIGHIYAAEPAANIINNYLSPGLTGSKYAAVRDGFKAWRYVGNLQNQAQLGLSGFHAMFTTLDAVTSKAALAINQATSGRPLKALASAAELPISPITNLIRGDRIFREGLTPGSTDPYSQAMAGWVAEAGGRFKMDDFYHTKAAQRMTDAFRHGNILGGIVRMPAGALDIASRPLMEWLVPRQKLGVFADLMKHELDRLGPDATTEQLREAADRVWDTVDNRMGQLVYDNLFWNKTIKDLSMASVRSVGWNLGDIRELGGAAKDVVTLPSRIKRAYAEGKAVEPIVTYRMAYAAALPLITGIIGASTMYLMTGKKPDELKDYFFPQTGNFDENGNPERLSLPTYMKDVYAYSKHPVKTLGHKMHPLIGLISDMLANKDYYGTEIRHPDDPFLQQMLDAAKHVGEGFVPFSVKGAMQEKDRQGSTSLKVLPFFGFTPAPKDVNSTKAEDLLGELQAAHRDPGSRTKAQAAKAKEIADLVRMKKKGQDAEFQAAFDKAKTAGILFDDDLKTIKDRTKSTYLEAGVTRLQIADAVKIYSVATDAERARIKDEMEKKIQNASQKFGKITDEMRKDLESFGFKVPAFRGTPDHPVLPKSPAGNPTIGARPQAAPRRSPGATIAPRQ